MSPKSKSPKFDYVEDPDMDEFFGGFDLLRTTKSDSRINESTKDIQNNENKKDLSALFDKPIK